MDQIRTEIEERASQEWLEENKPGTVAIIGEDSKEDDNK